MTKKGTFLTVNWSKVPERELMHVFNKADGHTLNILKRGDMNGIIGCPVCKENYFLVDGRWTDAYGETLPDGDLAMACALIWEETQKKSKATRAGK
jgi:hypothetical protein